MNYWGDLNISTLSGSFESLMKEKWEGEKDKGGRTNGRKEEVEEKEIEGGRKDGGDRRGKGAKRRERGGGGRGGGQFSDLGKNSASFCRQITHPPNLIFKSLGLSLGSYSKMQMCF